MKLALASVALEQCKQQLPVVYRKPQWNDRPTASFLPSLSYKLWYETITFTLIVTNSIQVTAATIQSVMKLMESESRHTRLLECHSASLFCLECFSIEFALGAIKNDQFIIIVILSCSEGTFDLFGGGTMGSRWW